MRRAMFELLFVMGFYLPASQPVRADAPTGAWPTATPEEQGIDSVRLAKALLTMQQEVPDLHSFLLIRDGNVLVDAYFYPYDGTTPHDLASVTKSVMTTLIGVAVDRGYLQLDQPVLSFFPDRTIANRDARKEQITVAQLASNTSGLDCAWQPDEPTLRAMWESDDWVQFALDLPMTAEPGSTWEYCSPGRHLLSAIPTEATGMTALDFAWAYLFGPLGMREVIWPADPQGYTRGWGDLKRRSLDAARLGQLWLDGGVWDARQIVSGDWVEAAATTQAATTREGDDCGYGWWIDHESEIGGQFSARGRGGQYADVFPALDVVVVLTGAGSYASGDALDLIAPALVDPAKAIPVNPAGVAQLTETVARLAEAPAPQPVPPLPDTAEAISGITFAFASNPSGIEALRLDFDGSTEAALEIAFVDEANLYIVPVGLDGRYRLVPGDYGFPMGLRGPWVDEKTFVVDVNEIANNGAVDLRLSFAGNSSIALELTDRTTEATVEIEGMAMEG